MHTLEIVWSTVSLCVGISLTVLQESGVWLPSICQSTFHVRPSNTDHNATGIKRDRWALALALFLTQPII